jgi:hypothetical protein
VLARLVREEAQEGTKCRPRPRRPWLSSKRGAPVPCFRSRHALTSTPSRCPGHLQCDSIVVRRSMGHRVAANGLRRVGRPRSNRTASFDTRCATIEAATSGNREKTIGAGCDDCNTKPVEFDRLLGNGCAPRRLQTKYPAALPAAVGACWEQAVAVAVPLMPAG